MPRRTKDDEHMRMLARLEIDPRSAYSVDQYQARPYPGPGSSVPTSFGRELNGNLADAFVPRRMTTVREVGSPLMHRASVPNLGTGERKVHFGFKKEEEGYDQGDGKVFDAKTLASLTSAARGKNGTCDSLPLPRLVPLSRRPCTTTSVATL